jgi:hypothetical protein
MTIFYNIPHNFSVLLFMAKNRITLSSKLYIRTEVTRQNIAYTNSYQQELTTAGIFGAPLML